MFTQLTESTYSNSIETTDSGVIICYKKLCPHCKNMEKVLEKFSKMETDVSFFSLDSEEDSMATKALGVERCQRSLSSRGPGCGPKSRAYESERNESLLSKRVGKSI